VDEGKKCGWSLARPFSLPSELKKKRERLSWGSEYGDLIYYAVLCLFQDPINL